MLQQVYVRGWRAARTGARRVGLLDRLEGSQHPAARHARTMFAIHDVQDLAHLDLPWWTYRAVERVEAHLRGVAGGARVFEYGSGASSMWLGRRAAEVVTVEHDERFVEFLRPMLAGLPAVRMLTVPATPVPDGGTAVVPSGRSGYERSDFADYVASIDTVPGEFDLVVVDGRARTACLERAKERLAPGGLVVFDNCNRERYREGIAASGLQVEVLRGLTPCLPYPTETAVLHH